MGMAKPATVAAMTHQLVAEISKLSGLCWVQTHSSRRPSATSRMAARLTAVAARGLTRCKLTATHVVVFVVVLTVVVLELTLQSAMVSCQRYSGLRKARALGMLACAALAPAIKASCCSVPWRSSQACRTAAWLATSQHANLTIVLTEPQAWLGAHLGMATAMRVLDEGVGQVRSSQDACHLLEEALQESHRELMTVRPSVDRASADF